jgi:hypothetical protein
VRVVRGCLLGLAVFQILSTLVGAVELLVAPQWFAPMLDHTAFAGQYLLAALLLGVVVGGFQWVAVLVHVRLRRWLPLGHALAGTVMVGWIAGECLVFDSFTWPHALWGGAGVLQLLLVLVLLGVLRALPGSTSFGSHPSPTPRDRWVMPSGPYGHGPA